MSVFKILCIKTKDQINNCFRDCEEEEDEEYEDLSDNEDTYSGGGRSEDDSVHSLDLEDTKSRFTEFSMSSSVVPRNDQLTLLDDRFEKVLNFL